MTTPAVDPTCEVENCPHHTHKPPQNETASTPIIASIDELDEIIQVIAEIGVFWPPGIPMGAGDPKFDEARTKILAYIDWVIGEDEESPLMDVPPAHDDTTEDWGRRKYIYGQVFGRNELRAEQRTRAGLSGGES